MLNPLTLRDQLLALAPIDNESAAITTLTNAYGVYAQAAVAGGVPLTPAGVALGKAAFGPLLTGMSVNNAGLSKIPAALRAFWVGVAATPAISFVGAIAVTPPPHGGFESIFTALMSINTINQSDLANSALAVANVFHAGAIVGGTVTLPGAPPIVVPIL